MGLAFALFVLFIVISLASIVRGITSHETGRILIAIAGCISCFALCYMIVYAVIKNSEKIVPVKPKPTKRRK